MPASPPTNRWFYLLLLPLAWSGASVLHFQWPGDEYAMWFFSSIAGTWALLPFPNVGDIHQWWIRAVPAVMGFVVMGAAGFGLCRLNVRKRVWAGLWFGFAVAQFGLMLSRYPSVERALASNGSWAAYINSAVLLAVYPATLLALLGGFIKWLQRKSPPTAAPANDALNFLR